VLELAGIVRDAGPAYLRQFGSRMLPSHRRALRDIGACRTAAMGGHVEQSDHCSRRECVYHSCRNRHCPKCHGNETRQWLSRQLDSEPSRDSSAYCIPGHVRSCIIHMLTFSLQQAV
jgi:hypothetical protein